MTSSSHLRAVLGFALAVTSALSGCSGEEPVEPEDGPPYCVRPTTADPSYAQAAYAHWKETLLTAEGAGGHLRVRRPNSAGAVVNSTVSEGIAYGMLLAVYMDDQETFDELWKYSQLHVDDSGLMNWYVGPDGEALGDGPATDSDEDIAFALAMAAEKWGGSGSVEEAYLELAKQQIERIYRYEVEPATLVLRPGRWGGSHITNISYFAPAFYRTFALVTGDDRWYAVIDKCYEILESSLNEELGNAENGLVPAWCDELGRPTDGGTGHPLHFQFDSCRTPFRIGQDWCWHGEPRAKQYLQKITSFYREVGLENIIDGYDLDGTPRPEFSVDGSRAAAFIGPAGVGAMHHASHQSFVDGAYEDLHTPDRLIVGDANHENDGSIYYNTSWRVMSLLMMDGTYQDWTLETAPE